jgi:hypothetical protein
MNWNNVVPILQLGITGLVFLLALMAYKLLHSESRRDGEGRPLLLTSIQRFTYFIFAMAVLVAVARPIELATPKLVELIGVKPPSEPDKRYFLDLKLLFGEANGQPRARIVPRTENDQLLAQKFANAKRSIKIVTETGATWLTADQEPNLRGAVKRDIQVTVLLHDYKNQYMFDALQKSLLMNNLPVYEPAHYAEKTNLFARYYAVGRQFHAGVHMFYPWTRFTIFDGTSVSFVLTPLLNSGSGVQSVYSEDPLVVAMFETIYKSVLDGALVFSSSDELTAYTGSSNNAQQGAPADPPKKRARR